MKLKIITVTSLCLLIFSRAMAQNWPYRNGPNNSCSTEAAILPTSLVKSTKIFVPPLYLLSYENNLIVVGETRIQWIRPDLPGKYYEGERSHIYASADSLMVFCLGTEILFPQTNKMHNLGFSRTVTEAVKHLDGWLVGITGNKVLFFNQDTTYTWAQYPNLPRSIIHYQNEAVIVTKRAAYTRTDTLIKHNMFNPTAVPFGDILLIHDDGAWLNSLIPSGAGPGYSHSYALDFSDSTVYTASNNKVYKDQYDSANGYWPNLGHFNYPTFDPEKMIAGSEFLYIMSSHDLYVMDKSSGSLLFNYKPNFYFRDMIISEEYLVAARVDSNYDCYLDFFGIAEPTALPTADAQSVPTGIELKQNYPNPFNGITKIEFFLPKRGQTNIDIYNANGQVMARLIDGIETEGWHTITWDGTNKYSQTVASGVYYCTIRSQGISQSKKIIYIK